MCVCLLLINDNVPVVTIKYETLENKTNTHCISYYSDLIIYVLNYM